MGEPARLRLLFDDRHVLSKFQRSSGLRRSWLLLHAGLLTVSDVASHIVGSFELHLSCPDGIVLCMDDFVLPPFESINIFKDKDVVRVRKKGRKHREAIKNSDDTILIEDVNIVNKKPLLLCDKILPVEEFEKESGGYQSEEECEDDEQPEQPSNWRNKLHRSESPKRKRKRTNDLQISKRKKSKVCSPMKLDGTPAGDIDVVEVESCPKKEGMFEKNVSKKNKRSPSTDEETCPTLDDHGTTQNKVASKPIEDMFNMFSEALEDNGSRHNANAGSKKTPSRSARRKKAKRLWLRKQANSEKKQLTENNLLENDNRQKSPECHAVVQSSDCDGEIVPVVVRPGHIRFEPLDEEPSRQHKPEQVAILQWNGITSKKKGQKWGREKTLTNRLANKTIFHEQYDEKHNGEKPEVATGSLESKRLVPLTRSPKEGDVVAYQLVELSTSWCPEISSDRVTLHVWREIFIVTTLLYINMVGRVASFDPNSMNAVMVPVPGHPLPIDKSDEIEPAPSLYKEDGSLEIDFSSLINVRVFVDEKVNDGSTRKNRKELTDESDKASKQTTSCNGKENHVIDEAAAPSSGTKEDGGWEEVNRALNEKKAELMQKDGWANLSVVKEHSSNTSWNFRALRRSAIGPIISHLRATKGL